MKPLHLLRTVFFASVLTAAFASGCSEKKQADEIFALEGKIDKIDPRPDGTGRLTVTYRDKKDAEMAGIGEVTKETEIMINGAQAKLTDLKVGERIRGQVRVSKQGKERKQTVLKISVERADTPKTGDSP